MSTKPAAGQTELFVAEFEAEVRRLAEDAGREAANAYARLSEIDRQVQVLARNMLVSEASPALHRLLRELEQEKAQLETLAPSRPATAQILPHPTLLQRFRTKLDQLAGALSDDSIRREAAAMMSELIHSVTIYPGERAEAEVSASLTDLIAFAANENDVQWTVRKECSVMVVAGVGFEPTTFRL